MGKERELKVEVDKLGGMKRDRDEKVEEVKNLNKAIGGFKRNEEAAKEKKEMEQKILVFKKTLESKTSPPDQDSMSNNQSDAKLCKTEVEKLAMKQKKMNEINLEK